MASTSAWRESASGSDVNVIRRVELLPAAGDHLHGVPGIGHQPRMLRKDALHPADHRWDGVVQQSNLHGNLLIGCSWLAWIARSMYTAADQPKRDAALGGFTPLSG